MCIRDRRIENYDVVVNELLTIYQQLGYDILLKINFVDSHLDFFPSNRGTVGDEDGESFQQDISAIQ